LDMWPHYLPLVSAVSSVYWVSLFVEGHLFLSFVFWIAVRGRSWGVVSTWFLSIQVKERASAPGNNAFCVGGFSTSLLLSSPN